MFFGPVANGNWKMHCPLVRRLTQTVEAGSGKGRAVTDKRMVVS